MTFPPITQLLPHREAMLLLEAVISQTAESVCCSARATEHSPFYRDGEVPAVVALEYMAQAVGTYVALSQRKGGYEPRVGFLATVREFEILAPRLPLNQALTVCAEVVFFAAGRGQFRCRLDVGEASVARATLTVVDPSASAEPVAP